MALRALDSREVVSVEGQRRQKNVEMNNTPGPGSYEIPDFLTEWSNKPYSFRASFKNKGRDTQIYFTNTRDGKYLAPGIYEYKDFVSNILHAKYGPTYGAKNVGRERTKPEIARRKISTADGSLCPGMYNTEKYLAIGNTPKGPTMSMIRPERKIASALYPGPGTYSLPPVNLNPPVTSSFTSRTARFKSKSNKVPGPGSYDRCINTPAAAESLTKMGKLYGLFFPIEYYP